MPQTGAEIGTFTLLRRKTHNRNYVKKEMPHNRNYVADENGYFIKIVKMI